jgi:SAM-dependent methyltransferase
LLEVGCGAGDFLHAANREGWEVLACEVAQQLAETVHSKLGLDVRVGPLMEGFWEAGSFDVIVYWEVIEHVLDPVKELDLVATLLRPTGVLFLSFPSTQAVFSGRRLRDCWAPLELPRHLHFFDRRTLSVMAERSGLRLIRYYTPFIDTLWCYLTSVARFARRRECFLARCCALAKGGVILLILLPLLLMEALSGHGPQAVAILKKNGG